MSKMTVAPEEMNSQMQPPNLQAENEKGLYEDEFVKITPKHLIIYNYYFPLGSAKCIEVGRIKQVELRDSSGVSTTWGISKAHLQTWFHQDKDRKNKHKYISVVVEGKKMKCGLTPVMIVKAYEALMEVCKLGEQETHAGMLGGQSNQQENLKIQED